MEFTQRLLITFLAGFAIAAGVSLLVFPRTSRQTVSLQTGGFLKLLQASILAQSAYLQSIKEDCESELPANGESRALQKEDSQAPRRTGLRHDKTAKATDPDMPSGSTEATALRSLQVKLGGVYGKMQLELKNACQEVAYGKLSPNDLTSLNTHLRQIWLPIIGMTTLVDIQAKVRASRGTGISKYDGSVKANSLTHLVPDGLLEICHKQFELCSGPMLKGLAHISLRLELTEKTKQALTDPESEGGAPPAPGTPEFAVFLTERLDALDIQRDAIIREWLECKGMEYSSTTMDYAKSQKDMELILDGSPSEAHVVLYVAYLTRAIGKAILKTVNWTESKQADGTMARKRIVTPSLYRIRTAWSSRFSTTGSTTDAETNRNVWMGDSLQGDHRDPEHLPLRSRFQRYTNYIRSVPRLLSSPESAFGFRASVATMTIGILAYLEQTRDFFLVQRLQWALFMIAISMSMDAGQNVFDFGLRIGGSIIAVCSAMVIWYVCDQKTGAIIPVLFLYLFCGTYYVIKYPRFLRAAIISIMSAVLLIGYELQARKIGITLATQNGQPYYQVYILGPYRLACVTGGLAVAFFWVYFPYPATTRHRLRQELGSVMYALASLYSCVESTVDIRLRSGSTSKLDEKTPGSPAFVMAGQRLRLFSEVVLLLPQLREHSYFTRFEPTIGGKFPKEIYDNLIRNAQHVFNYIMLMAYASDTLVDETVESKWLQDLRRRSKETSIASQEMTSLLCLLAASVSNGQPVPPYLKSPRSFSPHRRMNAAGSQRLSPEHVREPCFAALSVVETCSALITEEVAKMVKNVQELVGEVNFSFGLREEEK